jgi:rubrerythrin
MRIKQALFEGKIEKIQKLYRCNECNIMHDTPFQALTCFNSHKKENTKEEQYFNSLDEQTKRMLRREYSEDDFIYNKYKTVAFYAYDVK